MMKVLWSVLLLSVLSLAACDRDERVVEERFEPVVVYASYADEDYLPALFKGFTRDTRIPVIVRSGEPAKLVEDVIANRGSPPADVLLTTNVADIWRAADEGALRPIAAENANAVPDFLRDPDSLWAAAGVRVAVIAVGAGALDDAPTSYADLAAPAYSGKLCLSSSSLPVNRSLIAMLIAELRLRPAETVVRGWMRNLAQPVFETEARLAAAVIDGSCAYAIMSSNLAPQQHIIPESAYVDIEGIGIARHARYPESAQKLANWLLSQDAQAQHAAGSNAYAAHTLVLDSATAKKISARNVGLAGWQDNDAVLLADRAGYR